jgi:broad specificity phosphatase PhoE
MEKLMSASGLVYLVRHCATTTSSDSPPIVAGQNEDKLNENGEYQAKQLATYFKKLALTAAYCSTQWRAIQTVRRITKNYDINTVYCQSLVEADVGDWAGLTYDQILDKDPGNYGLFLRDPATYGYPGGETLSAVCRRAMRIMDQIVATHPTDHVLVVTHKQVIRTILAAVMSVPLHRCREIDVDLGGISILKIFAGRMEVKAVNHLPEALQGREMNQWNCASSAGVL